MLSLSLRRTQAELHSHRHWLRTFASAITVGKRPRNWTAAKVPCLGLHSRGAAAGPAAAGLKIRRTTSRDVQRQNEANEDLNRLGEAFRTRDIGYVTKYYTNLSPKQRNALPPAVIVRTAKTLSSALSRERRQARDTGREEDVEELIVFAQRLVSDWRAGNIVPVPIAVGRVLEFLQETGERDAGIEFWQWIRQQDPEKGFADANVYGSAIDLLAVNGTSLADLETLFLEALERYPGDYLAYHLSPTAIVPDREQEFLGLAAPYQLMKGIIHARLLYGASRDAYLAFDSLLRLWPDLNSNRMHLMVVIYQVLIEERSIPEAFTIFAVACRAGTLLPYDAIRQFMTLIRTSSDLSNPVAHVHALRQMLSVIYMGVGAGGRVTSNMINELLIAMSQTLRIAGIEAVDEGAKRPIVAEVLDIIRKSLETFSRYGAMPGIGAFNSIITNIAGWGGDKSVIKTALDDARSLGLEPNHVTRRSILTAAGIVRDAEMVRDSWALMLEEKVQLGQWPDTTDMHILVKAATRSGCVDFARRMFKELKEELPGSDRAGIIAHLDAPEPDLFEEGQGRTGLDLSVLLEELAKLRADMNIIEELTRTKPKMQNFDGQALPMTLYPPEEFMPEPELRKFYDELTTEQRPSQEAEVMGDNEASSSEAASGLEASDTPAPRKLTTKEPAYSATGIPFGTLRYENWKSVNSLLAIASQHDEAFENAIDDAIATGIALPTRKGGFRLGKDGPHVSYGISDAVRAQQTALARPMSAAEIQMARNRIRSLRGMAPES
nr:hypothetical protein CFP56_09655 [Quercus suber]